jgi:hypothetical protein
MFSIAFINYNDNDKIEHYNNFDEILQILDKTEQYKNTFGLNFESKFDPIKYYKTIKIHFNFSEYSETMKQMALKELEIIYVKLYLSPSVINIYNFTQFYYDIRNLDYISSKIVIVGCMDHFVEMSDNVKILKIFHLQQCKYIKNLPHELEELIICGYSIYDIDNGLDNLPITLKKLVLFEDAKIIGENHKLKLPFDCQMYIY